jgi:protein-disulfide isomerase
MSIGTAVVGFFLSFAVGASFMYYFVHSSTAAPAASSSALADDGKAWKQDAAVAISSEDPARGTRAADSTLVLFSDYQCPYCQRAEGYIGSLKKSYGDKLRIVWKDFPLPAQMHPKAMPAAIAARVAYIAKGNETFWKMHDKIFDNQHDISDENLMKWLSDFGIDKATYDAKKSAAQDYIKKSQDQGNSLGVNGTPSFFLDGSKIELTNQGSPEDQIRAKIEEHLKKAKDLRAGGATPADLYVKMSAAFKTDTKPAPSANPEEEKEDFTIWKAEIGDSPIEGNKNALITIVEYSDFECPFCKRAEASVQEVRKTYGDKVRLVWKNYPLPFHKHATPAANVSIEALKEKGNDAFWTAHDKLLAANEMDDDKLVALAKDMGLDGDKVAAAIKDNKYKDVIAADQASAEDLGVRGTPRFYVNGRVIDGAQPVDKFKKIIDEELVKADAKVKGGTPIEKLYVETIKDGKGGPVVVTVPPNAPFKGPKDAKVVIQIWSDYQCPFCRRFETPQPTEAGFDPQTGGLRVVSEKYGDKVKLVWRNLPLPMHPNAKPAAILALEAQAEKGNDAFWKVHDELFQQADLSEAGLKVIADKYGINWDKVQDAIKNDKFKDSLEADEKAAHDVEIGGTPSFIINGKINRGFMAGPQLAAMIDAALAKAK